MTKRVRDCDAALLKACEEGTVEEVRVALEAGASPNAIDEDSNTALMLVCFRESDLHVSEVIVNLLLTSGAVCSAQNKRGRTALHFAVSYSSVFVVQSLVSAWPFVNVCDVEGETPLTHLYVYERAKTAADIDVILRILLDAGAHPSEEAFAYACIDSGVDVIKLLLNAKADPNSKNPKSGNTALRNACRNRYSGVAIIHELIKAGAVVEEVCIRFAYQANADLLRTILTYCSSVVITKKYACSQSSDPIGCLRIGKKINCIVSCLSIRIRNDNPVEYIWALVRTRQHLVCCRKPHTDHDCFSESADPRLWRLLSIEMREQYDPTTWNTLLHTAALTDNAVLVEQVMKSNANPFLHNVEDLLPIEMAKDATVIANLKYYMRFRPSQIYMEWRGPYFRMRVVAFLLVCKRLSCKFPKDVIHFILSFMAQYESH